MIWKTVSTLGAVFAVAAALVSSSLAQQKPAPLAIGASAPTFSLEDQDGKKVSLAVVRAGKQRAIDVVIGERPRGRGRR